MKEIKSRFKIKEILTPKEYLGKRAKYASDIIGILCQPPITEVTKCIFELKSKKDTFFIFKFDIDDKDFIEKICHKLAEASFRNVIFYYEGERISDSCVRYKKQGESELFLRYFTEKHSDQLTMKTVTNHARTYIFFPTWIDLSTNEACNVNCIMCGSKMNPMLKFAGTKLDISKIKDIILQVKELNVRKISLTGAGEPFLDPRITELIKFINKQGLSVSITNNGTIMNDRIIDEIANANIFVNFSVHSMNEKIHDAIMQKKGAYKKAFTNIKKLLEKRKSNKHLQIKISTVVLRQNLEELYDFIRFTYNSYLDGHNLQPVNLQKGEIIGDKIIKHNDMMKAKLVWPTKTQLKEFDATVEKLIEFKRTYGHLTAEEWRLKLYPEYFRTNLTEKKEISCDAGRGFISISMIGKISPCFRANWNIGNIQDHKLGELWNSDIYNDVRKRMQRCELVCLNNCFYGRDL